MLLLLALLLLQELSIIPVLRNLRWVMQMLLQSLFCLLHASGQQYTANQQYIALFSPCLGACSPLAYRTATGGSNE